MRITLEVQRIPDELAGRLARRRLSLYRLLTRVQLRHERSWSEAHLAIVDTGAPYSLIPPSLWMRCRMQEAGQLPLRGIVPGRTAELDATLASITVRLLDARHTSPPLHLWAMLAPTDQVPLIIGWAGCLDRLTLRLDGVRRKAHLELSG